MKTIVTIDVLKINKSLLKDNSYENKEGVLIKEKNYTFDLVELKEKKFIKECSNGSKMMKTHFAAESQTKEERDAKKDTVFIGGGMQFHDGESSDTKSNDEVSW